MAKVKMVVIFIGVLLWITGCKPIQGLDDGELIVEEPEELVGEEVLVEQEEKAPVVVVDEVLEEARKPNENDPNRRYVRITTEFLNVREEAELGTPILTKIHLNEIYVILDEREDSKGLIWYRLEVPGDIIGWVSSDYCQVSRDKEMLLNQSSE